MLSTFFRFSWSQRCDKKWNQKLFVNEIESKSSFGKRKVSNLKTKERKKKQFDGSHENHREDINVFFSIWRLSRYCLKEKTKISNKIIIIPKGSITLDEVFLLSSLRLAKDFAERRDSRKYQFCIFAFRICFYLIAIKDSLGTRCEVSLKRRFLRLSCG